MPGGFAEAGDKHVALRRAADPRRIAQPEQDMVPSQAIEPIFGLDKGRDRDRGMVHQPLADARDMRDDIDPKIPQVPSGPDPSTEQVCWRMDRAGTDDDLTAMKFGLLAADQGFDADAPYPVEHQLRDRGRGRD